MKLSYVSRSKVQEEGFKRTKLYELLDEFANSEADFVELVLEPGEYANVRVACNCIREAINRFHHGFKVHMFKGKVYLDKV
jgi:hypothetical protein